MIGPVLLVVLTGLILNGYILGTAAPPNDFWSTYTSTAYSWWDLGSFFSPPSYLPYIFGGFPAYAAVQASGWFLPVGIATVIADYTPATATVVQAITVCFGSIGAYVLARSLGLLKPSATLAGAAYLFTPGFFGNAQHIDILRAWAFLPWLLFALRRPLRLRPWHYLLGALLWFQFLVGAYPGTIAASAYLCAAWAGASILLGRNAWRASVTWMAATVIPGALLSMVKWLPFLSGSGAPPKPGNEIVTTLGTISTTVYPYFGANLPNHSSMVSTYVASTVLVCAFFASGKRLLIAASLALIGASLILGVDLFGLHWQEALPLLDLSRFRTADFRMGIVLGLVLLGAAGAQALLLESTVAKPRKWWQQRIFLAGAGVGFLLVAGGVSDLGLTKVIRGLAWVAFGTTTVIAAVWLHRVISRRKQFRGGLDAGAMWLLPIALVILATIVVGWDWTRSASSSWRGQLQEQELAFWGATAEELIGGQVPISSPQRPARTGPDFPVPTPQPGQPQSPTRLITPVYNAAEYSRIPSVAGYANLKGQPIYDQMVALARDPEGVPLFKALTQPSLVWRTSPTQPTGVDSTQCLEVGDCQQPGLEVVAWAPNRIEVAVPSGATTGLSRVVLNELAYPGWTADIYRADGSSREGLVPTGENYLLLSTDVEPDDRTIVFTYATPSMLQGWICFGLGALLALAASLLARHRGHRDRVHPAKADAADAEGVSTL